RAARVAREQLVQLALELRRGRDPRIGLGQLVVRGDQGLGDVAAAVGAEAPCPLGGCAHPLPSARRTASTKARIRAGSLRPGSLSTPVATSTPQGSTSPTPSIAWATLSGSRPPARITS